MRVYPLRLFYGRLAQVYGVTSIEGGDHKPLGSSLVARMEERFFAPFKRNAFANRTWFVFTLAVILALHAAVLGYLLYRDSTMPQQVAKLEETPIEVIVEKPPEPPAEQKPPQPEPKQAIEKPATSAPRAPNEEKVETRETQKDTHAPKAPTPPTDGQPDKAQQATAPSTEPAPPDKTLDDAAKKDVVDKKDAEALDKAVPEPPKKPPELVAKPKPPAKVRADKSALDRLAGTSSLPDYSFARPTKKSPVSGGTEDARYLAIVYGMIMSNRHTVATDSAGGGNVTIAFDVDGSGRLVSAGFVRRSGYPEIDSEAMASIRRASPFPPPPPGSPHSLIATIDFGDAEPTLASGRARR